MLLGFPFTLTHSTLCLLLIPLVPITLYSILQPEPRYPLPPSLHPFLRYPSIVLRLIYTIYCNLSPLFSSISHSFSSSVSFLISLPKYVTLPLHWLSTFSNPILSSKYLTLSSSHLDSPFNLIILSLIFSQHFFAMVLPLSSISLFSYLMPFYLRYISISPVAVFLSPCNLVCSTPYP